MTDKEPSEMPVQPHESPKSPSRRLLGRSCALLGLLGAIALGAGACGSSSSSPSDASSSPTTSGGSGAATVVVRTASVAGATVLVDAKGFTLYTYSLDKPGRIACTASCVSSWPPLLVPAGAHLSMSLPGLGTEARAGGEVQVTFHGSPLYTFAGDRKPGEDNGVGIPHWALAAAHGAAKSSTTSTTSASGGGYGY